MSSLVTVGCDNGRSIPHVLSFSKALDRGRKGILSSVFAESKVILVYGKDP